MTHSIARNDLKGVKFIGWHVKDILGHDWQLMERVYKNKYSFDTGYTFGTNVREWQLDFMKPKKREALLAELEAFVLVTGWKIARFGKTAQIYTNL